MEYHRITEIIHVQQKLRHQINCTLIYITLEDVLFQNSTNDDYIIKVVDTLDEACKLFEVGFEFVRYG